MWGGSVDDIYTTVKHGIRFADDPDTRLSEMPAFGDILKSDEIREVAAYVVSLTGTPSNPALVEPANSSLPTIVPRATAKTPRATASSARPILPMRSG